MATFYVGSRPVLRGRSTANMRHTTKNKLGTYSYWANFSSDQVLTGFPDTAVTPGAGARPGNRFLSQVFNGTTLYVHPLANPTEDGYGYRFKPLQYKGLAGAGVFTSGYGHVDRVTSTSRYSNWVFDGLPSAEAIPNATLGHGARTDKTGAPSSFGTFIPDEFKGLSVAAVFTAGYGQAIPADADSDYGRNKVKEYRGVPSAKAL